jgi:hypothetical protein
LGGLPDYQVPHFGNLEEEVAGPVELTQWEQLVDRAFDQPPVYWNWGQIDWAF